MSLVHFNLKPFFDGPHFKLKHNPNPLVHRTQLIEKSIKKPSQRSVAHRSNQIIMPCIFFKLCFLFTNEDKHVSLIKLFSDLLDILDEGSEC